MRDEFYEFEHECDALPEGVRFVKIAGCEASQFTVDNCQPGVSLQSTVLYGFRFCPYCGKRPGDSS